MENTNPKIDGAPLLVKPGRRHALRKILVSAACTAPVLAAFAPTAAAAPNIDNHTCTDLAGSAYGVIGDHCTIHLTSTGAVTIDRINDHCNISGVCQKLTLNQISNHVKIGMTGAVILLHGTEDHFELATHVADLAAWRKANDRDGQCGN